jgi:hypothetical protein
LNEKCVFLYLYPSLFSFFISSVVYLFLLSHFL